MSDMSRNYQDEPYSQTCEICGKEFTGEPVCYRGKVHIECEFPTSFNEVSDILEFLNQLLTKTASTQEIMQEVFDNRMDPYSILRNMERAQLVEAHRSFQEDNILWEAK